MSALTSHSLSNTPVSPQQQQQSLRHCYLKGKLHPFSSIWQSRSPKSLEGLFIGDYCHSLRFTTTFLIKGDSAHMHRLAGPAEEPVKELLTCPNFRAFICSKHHVCCYLSSLEGNRKTTAPLALLAALVCTNIPPFRSCWAITLCLLCHTSSKHRAQFSPPNIERWFLWDPCCTLLFVDPLLAN